MLRILHVLHSVDPRSGGPSTMICNVIRQQVASGHKVSLLCTDAQSAEPWAPRDEYVQGIMADPAFQGADIHLLKAYGRKSPWSRYSYSPACDRWLSRRMSDPTLKPHVVHIHGIFSHLTTRAAARARSQSIPYIIRPAGCLDTVCYRMGKHHLKRLFTHLCLRKDLQGARFLHATSLAEAEELYGRVPCTKVRIVPNGADIPSTPASDVGQEFLAEFPELRGGRIVLYLARIAPVKRLELLVEAIARLDRDVGEIFLVIVGHDAGHKRFVEQTVARFGLGERVLFTGFLEGRKKQGAFAVADVYALPSLHENLGISVVEAMAHSVPVVVTRGVASHVHVEQAAAGLTVDEGVLALAEGVHAVLRQPPNERRAMGERGRLYVQRNLSWSLVAAELEQLYRECTAGSETADPNRAPRCLDRSAA